MANDPPRLDVAWRHALVAFVLFGFAAAGAGFFVATRRAPAVQPIAFNHRKHVVDNGMSCSDCHQSYQTETFSGMPDVSTCALCHEEPQGKSAQEKNLVGLIRDGRSLEWQRLFRQPPHIFFSHRRHVVKAGLVCETCHGGIGRASSPPQTVKRLTMNDCIACHVKRGAATDCTTCHR